MALALAAAPIQAASKNVRHHSGRRSSAPALVWYVEGDDGQVVDAREEDQPINPASVVKIATSWWALERLGPDYRFVTRFAARGTIDAAHGMLKGDLIVHGSGDPDFQVENAFLVAQALNKMGVRRVSGKIVVDGKFWIGWENGSQGTNPDPVKRATLMAVRLRQALDVHRLNWSARQAWNSYAARNGMQHQPLPSVTVMGGARYEPEPEGDEAVLFEHRSKPLADTLRRFNVFSNNDIERVAASIGTPGDLSVLLADRLVPGTSPVMLSTASGLGENRLSPRQIVAMLRGFRAEASRLGVDIEHLLPVAGCDPGTVEAAFPRLSSPPFATSLVAKTGTLTSTDGGITVLAGFLNTAQGEVAFCVAVPKAAGRIRQARRTEESFVVDLLNRRGGAAPRTCAPPLPSPAGDASIVAATVATNGTSGVVATH
jgi:D-alanyl-D-alanine carboxypeptidase/D-alanyl-D-alanine-endopeptidase (penicillin-binding protein 4)